MFNIFYHGDTGEILGYQEGAKRHENAAQGCIYKCLSLDAVQNLDNCRVDPDLEVVVKMPPNLTGEQRCNALFDEVVKLPEGCFVEIGVYKGGSAWYLLQAAKKQKRELHLFDTFQGIPYQSEYDPTPVGHFGDLNLEEIKSYLTGAVFHIGTFPETLTNDVKEIAFVYFDGDQYRGVKDVKTYLWPLMVSGGMICFDDSSLHGGMEGVNKAIDEEFGDYKIDDNLRMKYVIKP